MKNECTRLLLAVLLVSVSRAGVLRAEIFNCDGKWTNKPCEGKIEKVMPELERAPDLDAEALKKKKVMLNSLRNRVDEAHAAYGIDLDISGIEESCKSENTTYEECMSLVSNADDRLGTRVNQAKLVKEQEKTNKLLDESAKKKEDSAGGNQAISITQDNSVVVVDESMKIRIDEGQEKPRRSDFPHERKTPEKEKLKPKGGLGQGLQVR